MTENIRVRALLVTEVVLATEENVLDLIRRRAIHIFTKGRQIGSLYRRSSVLRVLKPIRVGSGW